MQVAPPVKGVAAVRVESHLYALCGSCILTIVPDSAAIHAPGESPRTAQVHGHNLISQILQLESSKDGVSGFRLVEACSPVTFESTFYDSFRGFLESLRTES
jgi:hypothetical protein